MPCPEAAQLQWLPRLHDAWADRDSTRVGKKVASGGHNDLWSVPDAGSSASTGSAAKLARNCQRRSASARRRGEGSVVDIY
jgi:hypothetical protein